MTQPVPRALLDEAGYPRGAAGVRFETEITHQRAPQGDILGEFLGTSWNTSEVDDEWCRAKFAEFQAATTLDEQDAALRELEMYSIEQFWQLAGAVGPEFSVTQPWVAGYNGESVLGLSGLNLVYARLWFDSSLKP